MRLRAEHPASFVLCVAFEQRKLTADKWQGTRITRSWSMI
ncbi:hypothetical protein DGo_PB0056 (plasmid) [Deinococcus gobiensis I-0]|uniref:Uncharacterized protein n=1 Tax=Deinococcus gobiensis (strain DSM 21396 / JCM 16679 / CGMCC 1.7299 / I-0) TaxID=745776 RepID=H8H1C8_DEIGI|nr:hypothetical protein DGo_PB0056 [Deinococcus gobiensis I-0]